MLRTYLKQNLIVLLLSSFCCLSAFKAKAGLDSYEIYLNDKLLIKQYVNEPLNLDNLGLDASNVNDRLVIHYSQCNVPNKIGKNRSIIVKDENGNIIKKWNFADAKESNTAMIIPVKELLQLETKSLSKLSLFYTAEGHATGQLLANFHFATKNTTYLNNQKTPVQHTKRKNSFAFIELLIL